MQNERKEIRMFRARLKSSRTERGLSLMELADLCEGNISRTSICQYEAPYNRVPKLDTLFVLAEALNVNPLWLMGMDNQPPKQKINISVTEAQADLIKDYMNLDRKKQGMVQRLIRDLRDIQKEGDKSADI